MGSLQSRVTVQLRDMILKGEFSPGERLAEIPLAEMLKASRTPVRLALTTLEHEGLIESSPGGGYRMRRFTVQEVVDAIRLRGVLEGFAARLVAEHGASRQLLRKLKACLDEGDRVINGQAMGVDDYTAYLEMNNRLHAHIVEACGNLALQQMIKTLYAQPFAAPSALLPMEAAVAKGIKHTHVQHHALVQAIERGQGFRAQALFEEHVETALMNFDNAMQWPDLVAKAMPGVQLGTDA